jgi:hypothetical protein
MHSCPIWVTWQFLAIVIAKGVRAFMKYIRESLLHPWLDPKKFYQRLHPNPQLRLA